MGIASAIILGLLGAGGAALSYFGAKKQAQTNQEIAAQNMQMQQQENEIARSREDNAVARRAADLEATGLSKTLAAGSAASSQLMIAPKNDYKAENFGAAALSGISQGMQVAQQAVNVQNTVAQTKAQELANDTYLEKHYADIDFKKASTEYTRAQSHIAKIVGENKQREIDSLIDSRIAYILWSNSDVAVNESTISLNAAKIYEAYRHSDLYDSQIAKYVQDEINAKLEYEIGDHNLQWAKDYDLPVGVANENIYSQIKRADARSNRNLEARYGKIPDGSTLNRSYSNGGYVW